MGMTAKAIQKQRPALRLVSTKDLSRDEWLKVRKQGIGSSDAAAAIGMNPSWLNNTASRRGARYDE